MLYLYVTYDAIGWSREAPTDEDLQLIDTGDLLCIEIKSDLELKDFGTGKEIPECEISRTPDGAEYHSV